MKRAFRAQIAKYHPDKVQHLGQEFQAMAADRAAELTEAYRILSDAGRRSEYDAARAAEVGQAGPVSPLPRPQPESAAPSAARPAAPGASAEAPPPRPPADGRADSGPQFRQERATRDTFVRKATVDRFRQALEGVGEKYDEGSASGFDLAFVPKSGFFSRSKNPRLLGRFVSAVDAGAIAETWTQAAKWNGASNDEVCVFLMSSSVAPPRDLAAAIAEQRRRPAKGGKVVMIPMDARTWDAHVPTDAPPICRSLITRLRSGT